MFHLNHYKFCQRFRALSFNYLALSSVTIASLPYHCLELPYSFSLESQPTKLTQDARGWASWDQPDWPLVDNWPAAAHDSLIAINAHFDHFGHTPVIRSPPTRGRLRMKLYEVWGDVMERQLCIRESAASRSGNDIKLNRRDLGASWSESINVVVARIELISATLSIQTLIKTIKAIRAKYGVIANWLRNRSSWAPIISTGEYTVSQTQSRWVYSCTAVINKDVFSWCRYGSRERQIRKVTT